MTENTCQIDMENQDRWILKLMLRMRKNNTVNRFSLNKNKFIKKNKD